MSALKKKKGHDLGWIKTQAKDPWGNAVFMLYNFGYLRIAVSSQKPYRFLKNHPREKQSTKNVDSMSALIFLLHLQSFEL